jgi:hypothetical protein
VSSSQTENIVQLAISACLGVEAHYSAAVTTHMTAPLRDHVLRSVAQIRIDNLDALDDLDNLLDNINSAFTKRNLYVHHALARDYDTNQCFIAKTESRGQLESELIPVTVDQIKADADIIREAGLNLMTFLQRNGLELRFPAQPVYRGHKTKAARKKRRKELLRSRKS